VHNEQALIAAFVKRSKRDRYREIRCDPHLRHKFIRLQIGGRHKFVVATSAFVNKLNIDDATGLPRLLESVVVPNLKWRRVALRSRCVGID
jgi:hypothetical protein